MPAKRTAMGVEPMPAPTRDVEKEEKKTNYP